MMVPICAPLIGCSIGYEEEAIIEANSRIQGCSNKVVYETCPDSINEVSVNLSERLPWEEAGGGEK